MKGKKGKSTNVRGCAAKGSAVGLYERLWKEKEEAERRRAGALPARRGLDSKVLDRRLRSSAPEDRARYRADLYALYRYSRKDVHSQGGAYRLQGLKRGCEKEYAELAAVARGQGELL